MIAGLWARYLEAPILRARAVLLLRFTLVLVAFDVWVTRMPHGGRYGAGGFNVAHFGWLDALGPPVTPGLYVGTAMVTGLLAFTLACARRPPPAALALVFALHTFGWSMSMLDSYQHHYLLSIVLLALVGFTPTSVQDAVAGASERSEPAYGLLAVSAAVVYAYTAFGKTSADWLSGDALQRVTHGGEVFAPLRELATGPLGMSEPSFWWAMGHSVVALQLVVCAAYLLAPLRDVAGSRGLAAYAWVGLFTALSFHLGAELLELEIGWFSAYMAVYATVMFLPGRWVWGLLVLAAPDGVAQLRPRWREKERLLRVGVALLLAGLGGRAGVPLLVWLGAGLGVPPLVLALARDPDGRERASKLVAWGLFAAGTVAASAAAALAVLPGGPGAALAIALALGLLAVELWHRRADLAPVGLGAAAAAACLAVTLATTEVRFDFHRNVGGDARRRGDLAAALEAYALANRFAPAPEVHVRRGPVPLDDGLEVRSAMEGAVRTVEAEVRVTHPDPESLRVALAHTVTVGRPPRARTVRARLRHRGDGVFVGVERGVLRRVPFAGTWRVEIDASRPAEGTLDRFELLLQRDRRGAEARVRQALRAPR
jgi:hypothetical protein